MQSNNHTQYATTKAELEEEARSAEDALQAFHRNCEAIGDKDAELDPMLSLLGRHKNDLDTHRKDYAFSNARYKWCSEKIKWAEGERKCDASIDHLVKWHMEAAEELAKSRNALLNFQSVLAKFYEAIKVAQDRIASIKNENNKQQLYKREHKEEGAAKIKADQELSVETLKIQNAQLKDDLAAMNAKWEAMRARIGKLEMSIQPSTPRSTPQMF